MERDNDQGYFNLPKLIAYTIKIISLVLRVWGRLLVRPTQVSTLTLKKDASCD